jgi:hypothetical protein
MAPFFTGADSQETHNGKTVFLVVEEGSGNLGFRCPRNFQNEGRGNATEGLEGVRRFAE